MIMATYETFAAVYDAVMDDSLYDKWTNFSLRHLPKTKERKKLLELACGTGIQSVRFSQAGFDVTGLDLSADMLKIAEKRATSAKQKIAFAEDFAMLWDTYEDEVPHSIVHELTFFIKEADGSFSRHDEVHEERTYEILTYEILLEQAGFKSFKLYADFEDKEPTETSTRWFFVAQK
uniref:SAM-dependent methyltransferase n=1 Tax=Streptococcus pneumoniae TaxID=1313 RepID=A0A4J1Y2R5_STREE|nr:SAM-dependent methyltransferase [Streptococcus pneumoniae]